MVEHVCHNDQLEIWASDVVDAIEPWLSQFDTYDDKVLLASAIKHEIRHIVATAFELSGKN